ncbi:unnamed protein product [Euphydryas editha]|uniref:Uncharacterized protein n=1 Tax=Euphydryas editha TaxID=104508 RepID=A0AAU9U2P6_EUPED|nr:unnamed protein product [Euphydryas editha]
MAADNLASSVGIYSDSLLSPQTTTNPFTPGCRGAEPSTQGFASEQTCKVLNQSPRRSRQDRGLGGFSIKFCLKILNSTNPIIIQSLYRYKRIRNAFQPGIKVEQAFEDADNLIVTTTNYGLELICTTAEPTPPELLKLISFKWKRGKCGAACGCRKAGINSSFICLHCSDRTCSNVASVDILFDDDDDDDYLLTVKASFPEVQKSL